MKKILILIIIILLGWGVWKYFISPEGETPPWEKNPITGNNPPTPPPSPNSSPTPLPEGNIWFGVLKPSTSPAKGNLMLELRDSDRTIYIQTSRDFSALMGKNVKVNIDGDFSDFSLVDIKEDI